MRRQFRGFTLIEVLIALVIFVIGALAVIRVFPAGLGIVRESGNSNVAARLSDSMISKMQGSGSTPQAVFSVDPATGTPHMVPPELNWLDQAGSVVGTSTLNNSLPTGPTLTAFSASALSHGRFIRGEKHQIKVLYDSSGTPQSSYILTNNAYDYSGGVSLYIDLPITGVTVNENGRLNFSNSHYHDPVTGAETSFSDGANAKRPRNAITLRLSDGTTASRSARSILNGTSGNFDTGTRYYVSYSWQDTSASPQIHSVINEPLSLPSDGQWPTTSPNQDYVMRVLQGAIRFDETVGSKSRLVIPGTVAVTVRLNLGAQTSTPAGLYAFPNSFPSMASGSGTQNFADTGFVSIVPSGSGAFVPKVPVYADYFVSDWRTLFDDSNTGGNGKVNLPVRMLSKNLPVLGLTLNPPAVGNPTKVNKTTGELTYTSASAGGFVRSAYRGLDGWARQVAVSPSSFVPYVDTASLTNVPNYRISYNNSNTYSHNLSTYYLPREPWREYYWVPGSSTMYFHPSQAGQMVSVSYVAGGNTYMNQVMKISKAIINVPSGISADFAPTGKVVELNLVDKYGNSVSPVALRGVRGVGVIARTAWLSGRRYQQSVATGYRSANGN